MLVTVLRHANETGKSSSALQEIKQGIKMVSLYHKIYDLHEHHTGYYDDETKEVVANLCTKEIEFFGY